MQSGEDIKRDFDRIASLPEYDWSANKNYHNYLLKNIPDNCQRIIDIGCGKGEFTKLLLQKSKNVIGIDLSPKMISKARAKSKSRNIVFRTGNYLEAHYPENHFDCIVSIATVHHLDMKKFLDKAKKELRLNGSLLILDLYKQKSAKDYLLGLASLFASFLLKLYYNRKLNSRQEQQIWEEHGQTDTYPTMKELHKLCAVELKDAKLTQLLFWRYSIIWEKTIANKSYDDHAGSFNKK